MIWFWVVVGCFILGQIAFTVGAWCIAPLAGWPRLSAAKETLDMTDSFGNWIRLILWLAVMAHLLVAILR